MTAERTRGCMLISYCEIAAAGNIIDAQTNLVSQRPCLRSKKRTFASIPNAHILRIARMRKRLIDPHAIDIPRKSGLAPCLFIPIAARDTKAIETYVGKIIGRLGAG